MKTDYTMEKLDLEILHTFVVIIEMGSYTKASNILFKSQSAISEQIQKLEVFCDAQLLHRGRYGAKPTAIGEKMYKHAKKILSLNDNIIADIRNHDLVYELTLSITDYFMPATIASVLRGLRDQCQNIQFNVSIQSSSKMLLEHTLEQYDIALFIHLNGQRLPDNDNFMVVGHEPLCWAGSKDLSITGSAPLPIITLPKGCLLQKLAIDKLENNKISYNLSHYASSVIGMQSAIEAQLGIGCLNRSSMSKKFIDYTDILKLPALPDIDYIMYYKSEKNPFINTIKGLVERVTSNDNAFEK